MTDRRAVPASPLERIPTDRRQPTLVVETPRKTLREEIAQLEELVNQELEGRVDAFYLGAIQALQWIDRGWAKPSEADAGRLVK